MNRLLLLLKNRENQRLLGNWLTPRFEIVEGAIDRDFDLLIVDGPSLIPLLERLNTRKKADGTFLPVLLITARQEAKLVARQLWKTIDEILFLPIDKIELQARVEILLRTRRLSLELEQSRREIFRALVEQSLVGVYQIEGERLTYFNEAAAKIFGYRPEELIGKMDALSLVQADDRARVAEKRGQGGPQHFDFRGLRKDGSSIQCEVFERKIENLEKKVLLGTLIDVTERRQAQKEKDFLQKQQLETLKQADRLKDEFLSVISHELKTPINAIMGFGSILQDGIAGPLTDRQHDYVGKILKGTDRMLMLVDDLLDFARMQAGKFGISRVATDYPALVAEAVAFFEPVAAEKNIEIERQIQVPVPILVDRDRILQVISHLLSNAIKFSHKGGKIRLKAFLEGPLLVTEVRDNGCGIDLKDLPRLFRPFTQLDMGSTRKTGGLGIGLSLSKAIIEAHGGTLEATSELGTGSTFIFKLPLD